MLYYSFMSKNSNASKEEALELLKTTDKDILYTYGLRFRNPTTMDVLVSKERALEIFNSNSTCDVKEYEDHIRLNAYGEMDLW